MKWNTIFFYLLIGGLFISCGNKESKQEKEENKVLKAEMPESFERDSFTYYNGNQQKIDLTLDQYFGFGFILRYPENKIDVTGISFEPWHFRYVGIPHSLIMEKEGLVLEEYLDTLREEKELTIKVDGEKYFIQFMDNQDLILNSVKIPDTAKFTVSGDNLGGLIITSLIE